MQVDGFGKKVKEPKALPGTNKDKKDSTLFKDIKSYKPQGIYKNIN